MTVDGATDCEFSSIDSTDVTYGARSHIGGRKTNQDELRLPLPNEESNGRGILFAVADGMGGHKAGATASRMASEGLTGYFNHRIAAGGSYTASVLRRHLEEVIHRSARHIRLAGRRHRELEDMGTTLSCLVLLERFTIVAHVGDSRVYRLRKGHLTRLTTDHTFVQEMVDEGEVKPEEAVFHPLRNLLTRAVGTMESLEMVDTRIDRLHPGDHYLLCSDGLYNAVDDQRIAGLLSAGVSARSMAAELVDAALANNARDNVTAVVIVRPPSKVKSI